MSEKNNIIIGTQGWNYEDWISRVGSEAIFYPSATKPAQMLEIYAKAFESVEVDSTFYAIPAEKTVENWYLKTPENFTFALKLPQEITHVHLLSAESFPVLEMFVERIAQLKEKLSSVLIQLPPNFEANKENAKNFRSFLSRLPSKIRFAVEFRNREWLIDWTFRELEKNNVSLALVEGNWIPRQYFYDALSQLSTDFLYLRFMGERDLESFEKVVRPQEVNLQIWLENLKNQDKKEVFVYFSNFYEGFAVASANKFKELCGQAVVDPKTFIVQKSLF